MDVKTLEGRVVRVDPREDSLPAILYIWDPGCHWCRRNEANVRALAQQTRGRYRLMAISLSRLEAGDGWWRKHFQDFLYQEPTEATKRAYALRGVPQTIVVSRAGTVEAVWQGAYADELHRKIEQYFGVRLPGLGPSGVGSASTQ